MLRRIVRTCLVGVVSGALLLGLVVPAIDAVGRLLLLPPVFRPASRWMIAALWVTGLGAAWVYRPAEASTSAPSGREASDTHPGGP